MTSSMSWTATTSVRQFTLLRDSFSATVHSFSGAATEGEVRLADPGYGASPWRHEAEPPAAPARGACASSEQAPALQPISHSGAQR
jgi:hypothetical protein